MSTKDYKKLSNNVLEAIGGKNNIKQLIHCATRLRFNLINDIKDVSVIEKIPDALGTMKVGEQFQVIIGLDVDKVYVEMKDLIEGTENTLNTSNNYNSNESNKNPIFNVFSSILDALSGTMGPVIPAIVASAFFKMLIAILGPELLNILSEQDNLYVLLSFVGDAAFYFFPVIVGYTAAQKFKVTPTLGILMGAILIHPTLISLVEKGEEFSVFGFPMYLSNYSGTIIPVFLSVWLMSYLEKGFNKIIPNSLRSVFTPAFTILSVIPISLWIVAPAGTFLGNYIAAGLFELENIVGFLGIAIIAALYPILVMTGMHMVIIMTLFQVFTTQGFDGFAAPALCYASFSVMGVGIGAFLRLKNKEEKSLAASYALTALVAGTSEPTIYGICTRYKKPFIGLMAGGFLGGIYGGLTKVISATLVPSSSVTSLLTFIGKSSANIINGVIASLISLVAAALITYYFGFDKEEPGLKGQK